ncbi:MAG: hypothetical protein ACOYI5_02795 [Christensenellales bacterium]|jgi:hypothetical protein
MRKIKRALVLLAIALMVLFIAVIVISALLKSPAMIPVDPDRDYFARLFDYSYAYKYEEWDSTVYGYEFAIISFLFPDITIERMVTPSSTKYIIGENRALPSIKDLEYQTTPDGDD